METSDILKDPILASTNGAHDSSKEVGDLGLAENVSDLKEQTKTSLKESSPVLIKEFSLLSDRKELSPEPPSKEESPVHSSKESSPLRLSKEPSPLPTRKEPEASKFDDFCIGVSDDQFTWSADKPSFKSTEAFVLSESIDNSHPSVRTEPPLPTNPNDVKGDDLATTLTETKVLPTRITPDPEEAPVSGSKVDVDDTFGFNKPLPPEPIESTADFLKSETNYTTDDKELKPVTPKVIADDDFMTDTINPQEEDIARKSPSPPPVPKHQNLLDDSSERYEPSQTPEPDFAAFKPVSRIDDKFGEPVKLPEPIIPVKTEVKTPNPEMSPPKKEEKEEKEYTFCKKQPSNHPDREVIGPKDIRGKIVESLIYWRDPKKSGIVFGVAMVSLLSLTYYSLISVVAYLCLFTLGGTITFRVYKNIMQAVQKTSDGHPFKNLLEIDMSVPEDKVAEVSQCLVQYLNTSLTTLRSLFLVEDLIDSIKFVVLLWVLTYVGACFNGLTLIIIGVILLFSLPKVYENNKAQIDIYMKMAMDKLSVITNRMKAAVPEGKKDDKPKDQ